MMKGRPPKAKPKPLATFEQNRDMYGFMVRPQHLERYREYATIYKEEEAERSDRWEQFLTTVNENVSSVPCPDLASAELTHKRADSSEFEDGNETVSTSREPDELGADKLWGQLRKSLWAIERAASIRGRSLLSSQNEPVNGHIDTVYETILGSVEQNLCVPAGDKRTEGGEDAVDIGEVVHNGVVATNSSVDNTKDPDSSRESEEGSGEDSEDEFCDATESTDILREGENTSPPKIVPLESPWEEELRSLVRGGVPMALRGEVALMSTLWQVFVSTKTRRVRGQYNALLTLLADGGNDSDGVSVVLDGISSAEANHLVSKRGVLEKWASQIEKDLPRTFPGHPALDEDGRNTLRRLLTAYARHNPSVGYCQAMNFLAALLLLLMPEENAFWTLTAIVDDYFEGYYSERMVEAQVDQLVFEDLAREQFPKLVSHLDALGVQVAWISGPWFLTIFVNVLPWESVLRVWDVLLYEGNRRMLFCTGLALMEIHAPALAATRDAGDAVALLQSMASATFDSSQLVLMACMGFQSVRETRLQGLRVKHRPTVLAALDERSTELHLWRNSNSAGAPKLPYLFGMNGSGGTSALIKSTARVLVENGDNILTPQVDDVKLNQQVELNMRYHASPVEGLAQQTPTDNIGASLDQEDLDGSDIQEQIVWLKNELCRALEDKKATLEDKKAAVLRAEELEAALVEIVREDNRLLLSAKVEKLEAEVDALNHLLADKKEQEQAMVQVLVRMEQEQLIADDARRFAELDSTAQRRAAEVFQEKYESAADALAEMEKRAVMAESMLEATLSYQALGNSPHGSGSVCRSEPLLVRTPELAAAGSPSLKDMSPTLTNHQNGSGTSSVHNSDEKANKQGIFNRPFGLNWRDRSKARSGNFDSPTRSPMRTLSERAVERAVNTDI